MGYFDKILNHPLSQKVAIHILEEDYPFSLAVICRGKNSFTTYAEDENHVQKGSYCTVYFVHLPLSLGYLSLDGTQMQVHT
jgi:hypothetical protein